QHISDLGGYLEKTNAQSYKHITDEFSIRRLNSEWPLDDLMCKMYHFVQSLSYTTSILTLVMISIERYLVIVFPLHAKNMLHKRKLILWMFGTVTVPTGPEEEVVACIIKYHLYNPKIYHIVNFIALFLVPITVMTVIYSIVYCRLNDSEKSFKRLSRSGTSSTIRSKIEVDNESTQIPLSARKTDSRNKDPESNKRNCVRLAKSGELSIEKRRKLTILLIAIVVGFFICNFPLHCRKLIQDWYPNYDGTTDAAIIATIATNLLLFFNSGLNPLLYALLSQNFRENMAQILCFRRN
ncbi:substance-P receptor-like protein, partial [Dinothrombium tinctorium]